jgi:hypothetical protein
MAVTLDELTLDRIVVLPPTWDEVDVRNGIVAREWEFDGILLADDCASLQELFAGWAAARAGEPGPSTGTTGTTVAFTGAAAGESWTNVACWFSAAPVTPRIGAKYRCSFRLVDAAQAVAAELALLERTADEELDYGTFTLAGVELTLLEQPEGFSDGPGVEPSAGGTDVIRGPLLARDTLQIRGYTTDAQGWPAIKTWYRNKVSTLAAGGTWYPTSAPAMRQERRAAGGAVVTRYLIDVDLRKLA